MDYVYAVVENGCVSEGFTDIVYAFESTADVVANQLNKEYWIERDVPIQYRKKAYNKYKVKKIPLYSRESI